MDTELAMHMEKVEQLLGELENNLIAVVSILDEHGKTLQRLEEKFDALDARLDKNEKDLHLVETVSHKTASEVAALKLVR